MDKCIIISQSERVCLTDLLTESINKLDNNKFNSLFRFRFDVVNDIKVNYKSILSKIEDAFND